MTAYRWHGLPGWTPARVEITEDEKYRSVGNIDRDEWDVEHGRLVDRIRALHGLRGGMSAADRQARDGY